MKKLVICVAVLGMVWTSSAMADPVALVNPGFELPAWDAQVNGFDGQYSNHPDVPGWEDDCDVFPSPPDKPRSGVLAPNVNGHTGIYAGFLIDQAVETENVMWQLTGKTIAAGEVYTLTVWAHAKWTGQNMKLSLFSDDGLGNHTEVAVSAAIPVPGDEVWREYSEKFTIAAGSPAIDKTLGIAIEHIEQEAGVNHWMSYDDVTLDVVPEPATMMLLGLGSLALLRRRRA